MKTDNIKDRIAGLDDEEAIKMLNTVAKPYAAEGVAESTLEQDQVSALMHTLRVAPASPELTDGEMARRGLLLMAQSPEFAEEIEEFLLRPDMRVVQEETPVQILDSQTLLYALKTSVNFERSVDGQTTVRVTPLRPDTQIIRGFVEGLLTKLPPGPRRVS